MPPDSEKGMSAVTDASNKPLVAGNGAAKASEGNPGKPKKKNYLLSWIRTEIKTFNMNHVYLAAKSPPLGTIRLTQCRGSIPSIIFFAMFQSTPVATALGTQSYLIALVCWVLFSMQPRAKFFRSLYCSIFLTCMGTGWTTLGLWCARQARLHTQGPNDVGEYNSSAAAVAAIFCFVNFYSISCFRAVISPFKSSRFP